MSTNSLSAGEQPTKQMPKSLEVLCLGMCRTGTSSLLSILTTLGYTPVHMTRILEDPNQKNLWTKAIEDNFINQNAPGNKPYGRAEFDILLSKYNVALDVPCAIFAEHLIKAYPEAKVVLTTRPTEKWIASMQNTIWRFMQLPSYRILRYLEPEYLGSFMKLVELIFFVHNGGHYGGPEAERAFVEHNERIRRLVPKERLLELSPPFNAEDLCTFLGKPVPTDGYPHVNSGEEYLPKISARRNRSIMLALKRFGKALIQLSLLGILAWFIYRSG